MDTVYLPPGSLMETELYVLDADQNPVDARLMQFVANHEYTMRVVTTLNPHWSHRQHHINCEFGGNHIQDTQHPRPVVELQFDENHKAVCDLPMMIKARNWQNKAQLQVIYGSEQLSVLKIRICSLDVTDAPYDPPWKNAPPLPGGMPNPL